MNKHDKLCYALKKLAPNANYSVIGEDFIWRDKNINQPSEDDINNAMAEAEGVFNNNEYKYNRVNTYPSIQEQLDMQYCDSVNGTTTWKDAIAKVKTDIPKPSE